MTLRRTRCSTLSRRARFGFLVAERPKAIRLGGGLGPLRLSRDDSHRHHRSKEGERVPPRRRGIENGIGSSGESLRSFTQEVRPVVAGRATFVWRQSVFADALKGDRQREKNPVRAFGFELGRGWQPRAFVDRKIAGNRGRSSVRGFLVFSYRLAASAKRDAKASGVVQLEVSSGNADSPLARAAAADAPRSAVRDAEVLPPGRMEKRPSRK